MKAQTFTVSQDGVVTGVNTFNGDPWNPDPQPEGWATIEFPEPVALQAGKWYQVEMVDGHPVITPVD